MKICPVCSKEFKPKRKDSKTCSRKCGGILGSKNTLRINMKCRICNKETTVKYCSRSLPVYCSTECRNKRHLKNCLNCNKEFYTAKTATKTCSDICATKYRQSLTRSEVFLLVVKNSREQQARLPVIKIGTFVLSNVMKEIMEEKTDLDTVRIGHI